MSPVCVTQTDEQGPGAEQAGQKKGPWEAPSQQGLSFPIAKAGVMVPASWVCWWLEDRDAATTV